jgi:hypothetical protein
VNRQEEPDSVRFDYLTKQGDKVAKTVKDYASELVSAKDTATMLQVLSSLFVNTCVVAVNAGIADSFIAILTTAESVDRSTFSAVAKIVDTAERKARDIVGAHRSTTKEQKDVNSVKI